jgi:hypothetical protein
MGLLDDAIREHLDLKRRRGADPAEVEQAEQEALGPVRRGPEPSEPLGSDDGEALGPELADEPVAEHLPAYDHEDDPDWSDAEYEEPVRPAGSHVDELEEEHEELAPHDEHEAPEPPRQHQPVGDETAEYDVEEALEHEHKSDDMLEETPEFLQDTPDHDRLWFEQKPPRDFKFDG